MSAQWGYFTATSSSGKISESMDDTPLLLCSSRCTGDPMAAAIGLAKSMPKGHRLIVWAGNSMGDWSTQAWPRLCTEPADKSDPGHADTPKKKNKAKTKNITKPAASTNQLDFTLQVAGRWPMTNYVATSTAPMSYVRLNAGSGGRVFYISST